MKIRLLISVLVIMPLLTISQETEWFCTEQERTKILWIDTDLGKQKLFIALPPEINEKTKMLVYLHGDAPFNNPEDQYYIVRDISAVKNYISIAILRPGYEDNCGSLSEGIRGRTMGDNYTRDVLESIAEVLHEMKLQYNPNELILMGHSGGGALSTLFVSIFHGLVDRALIFSCPCDLNVWRKNMFDLQGDPRWLEKMPGLSPFDYVGDLDPNLPITFVVGANDSNTLPSITQQYTSTAKEYGKNVTVEIWDGHNHFSVLFRDGFRRMLGLLD